MAALFVPNGVRQDMWTPEGEGREFKLSPTLEPLADLKDQLLIPTNLWNQASNFGDGHYVKMFRFSDLHNDQQVFGDRLELQRAIDGSSRR